VIVDVNGYDAPHNRDDRYFKRSVKVLVAPLNFIDRDAGSWVWDNGIVEHGRTLDRECISAPVELPEGVDVIAAQLIYATSDSVEVSVSLGS
jgi:hypothetical protein